MRRLAHTFDLRSIRPPLVVVVLLTVEIAAVVALLLLGSSFGDVLKWAGIPVALTLAFLNPTVQELGRRQAKLSIIAEEADKNGVVTAPAPSAWPIDPDRIVANELAAAREPLSLPHWGANILQLAANPIAGKPTEADHARARTAFEALLPKFEATLRDWLNEYTITAKEYSQTFDLTLRVENAPNAAHADAVTIVLDLPTTIHLTEDRPTILLPPERPHYEPPRSRFRQAEWLRPPLPGRALSLPIVPFTPFSPAGKSAWKSTSGGQCLEASVGGVHCGRSIDVGKPLLLSADCSGEHEIGWTAYTTSARRAAKGTITLVVPPGQPNRPAIGRLYGVTSYPDVPIVDSDDEIAHPDPRSRPSA